MESQLRGMNVAIRNSQDGISLVQTAEAGMSEITNMIIRMRELSVQMNNGVYTNSDRANAQLEIDALLAEIDKIATNTAFNDVKVLDGSYDTDIRAGNTNPENIQVAVTSQKTTALGGVSKASLADNSTAAGLTGVTATDYVVNSSEKTVTTKLKVDESQEVRIGLEATNVQAFVSGNDASTHAIEYDASTVSGYTWSDANQRYSSDATVNYDSATAANNLKNFEVKVSKRALAVTVAANDASWDTDTNSSTKTITSSVNLQEGNVVKIDQSTAMDTLAGTPSAGAIYNVLSDLDSTGDNSNWTVSDDGRITRSADSGSITFDHNTPANNIEKLTISAYNLDIDGTKTLAASVGTASTEADGATSSTLAYGNLGAQEDGIVSITLNTVTAATIAATASWDDVVTYSLTNGSGDATGWAVDSSDGTISKNVGHLTDDTNNFRFSLVATDSGNRTHTVDVTFSIDAAAKVATENLTINVTESEHWVETIAVEIKPNNDYLANVDVSTSAGAARAVTILDKALDEISSSQAKLGAIQNRLQHNIDNLSNGSRLTETARGRIVDADFARETSELSKQQILGQAATSMLAQANQSKQSVLALLQ